MPHAPTPWVGLVALLAMFCSHTYPTGYSKAHGRSATGRTATSAATATPPGSRGIPADLRRARPLRPFMESCAGSTLGLS
jgi:hypothetical protein